MAKDVPSIEEIMRRVTLILNDVNSKPYVPKLFSAKNPPNQVSSWNLVTKSSALQCIVLIDSLTMLLMQDDVARYISHPPLPEDDGPAIGETPSPPQDEVVASPRCRQLMATWKRKARVTTPTNDDDQQQHE